MHNLSLHSRDKQRRGYIRPAAAIYCGRNNGFVKLVPYKFGIIPFKVISFREDGSKVF
jgi:hypothetical protein